MAKGQYYHVPLPGPRYTRVVHLDPATDPTAPIQCRVQPISLDDHPEWDGDYTALSYTWDSQRPSRDIGCHDGSLLVTATCEEALRELRHDTDVAKLWIDIICIDQTPEGLEERNSQVALMGQIYKCAGRVVVWLGTSDVYIKTAMDTVQELVGPLQNDSRRKDRRDVQRLFHERATALSKTVKSQLEDPLGFLFERNWFHRMWTVQEASLSWVDRIYLKCGKLELEWSQILLVSDALRVVKYPWCRWQEAMGLQQQFTTYLAAKRYRGVKEILNDNPGDIMNDPLVFAILSNARRKKSKDPKDKVFALYGLLSELEIPIPPPDYSLSVETVYREATMASINYDRNLYILYHAPSDRRRETLASWVPDWAEDGWEQSDPRYGLLRSRFSASGSAEPVWRFSEDGTALILRGMIVDTIIFRNEPLLSEGSDIGEILQRLNAQRNRSHNGRIRPSEAGEYMRLNHEAFLVLKAWTETSHWSDYPTGEPSKIALQRTLVNDNPKCNSFSTADDNFEHWYHTINLEELDLMAAALQHQDLEHHIPEGSWERETFLRTMKEKTTPYNISHSALCNSGFDFHSLAMAFSQKKCFFYTEKSYFGTAADPLPVSIQHGDKIAIVSGLEMPLALRPIEGGYRLLTHVYVHGIMYGEAWPENDDDLVEITLL
ncbi:hypothetical protein N7467_000381 [Penicillium canescens]|nr:hypothetical protein N7467_000381 [Penicillium canescens]